MPAILACIAVLLILDGVWTIRRQARTQSMPSFGAFFALGLGIILLACVGIFELARHLPL